jgi:hypothetical protein
VIVHEGYSTSRGHYYCFIKNQATGIWFKYDDDDVKPIGKDLSSVKKFTQNAYILFYKKHYLDCQKTQCHNQDTNPQEVITSISRSRSPSFYHQLQNRTIDNQIDYFEKVRPANDRLIHKQSTKAFSIGLQKLAQEDDIKSTKSKLNTPVNISKPS